MQFLSTVKEGPFQRRGNGLQLFEDLLRIAFASSTADFKAKIQKCYKVHVAIEEPKKKNVDTWLSKGMTTKKGCRILSYWCFSPGFGYDFFLITLHNIKNGIHKSIKLKLKNYVLKSIKYHNSY